MSKNNVMPITVLTGYLGSGKTTLVNNLLADPQGMKIAVIVNDIGEVNIDATLIQAKGHASVVDENLVALTNGCICCSLQEDLITQIAQLMALKRFDYILIEASGVCLPQSIAETILAMEEAGERGDLDDKCRLDGVVTVVDAYRLLTDFSGGQELLDEDMTDIASLVVEQIEFCNLVLLNKTDLLSEGDLAKVEAIVKALQPSVQVRRTQYATVPTADILNIRSFEYVDTARAAGWAKTFMEHDVNEHHDHDEHDHHGEHHDHDHDHDHHDHDHDEHEHHDHHDDRDHDHGHHHHDHDHDHGGQSHLEEYGISTFVYYRRRPFSDAKLEAWVNNFPSTVVRCKGIAWIDDGEEVSYLLEQAGQSVTVTAMGPWLASEPKAEIEKELARNPAMREEWDEQCGDRMNKLVFIGVDMDEEAIVRSLDDCLANESGSKRKKLFKRD